MGRYPPSCWPDTACDHRSDISVSVSSCDHHLRGGAIGYLSRPMSVSNWPWPESWPRRGEDVAFAAPTATTAAEGGPPLMWRCWRPLPSWWLCGHQVQHPHPLLAMSRAMANWMRIIGCDTYPILWIMPKGTHPIYPMTWVMANMGLGFAGVWREESVFLVIETHYDQLEIGFGLDM